MKRTDKMWTGATTENKSFLRRLIYLSLPIMLQEFINNGSGIIMSVIVGNLGLYALTAVGIGIQINFVFTMFAFGINTSVAVYAGQFWGRGDVVAVRKTMGIGLISGVVNAALFAFTIIFFPEQIMQFLSDGNPNVVAIGCQYLRVAFISYIMIAVSDVLKFTLRATGQTRIPVVATFVSTLSNAAFCYLFINILNLGAVGAAYAVVLSRTLEVIVQVTLIIRFKLPVVGRPADYLGFNRAFVAEFFKLGAPVILNEVLWSVGTLLYIYCYKFTGTEGQGASQIAQAIFYMFTFFGIGIGSGSGIMITNALGAGDIETAQVYAKRCLKMIAVLNSGMGVLLVLLSPLIVGLYDVPDVVKMHAIHILRVIAIGLPLKGMNYAMIVSILRSGGDTRFCLIVDSASVWLVALPIAYICARFVGVPVYGVTIAIYTEEVVKFAICFVRTLKGRWARNLVADLS